MVNKKAFLENYQNLDNSVIIDIIDIFLAEYSERMEKLFLAAADKDFAGLRFYTHDLKGLVASFFDLELLEFIKTFEKQAILLDEGKGTGYNEADTLKTIEEIRASLGEMATSLSKIKQELQENL